MDYPEEADSTSFVTISDLKRIAAEIHVGPGQTFVDLACGRGGPGLWVARETGAALTGIDASRIAIEHASRNANNFSLDGKACFRRGDFIATGLPSSVFNGAMSVDALWMVPDKASAICEIKRILHNSA